MHFEIVGEISDAETIAAGRSIRRLKYLQKRYGGQHWRKRKALRRFDSRMVPFDRQKCTGMKPMVLGERV